MGLEVHCVNSGQGNSIILELPDGSFMVVDIDCHGDTPVDPIAYLKELVPEEYDTDEDRHVKRLACAAFTHPHQATSAVSSRSWTRTSSSTRFGSRGTA